MFKDISTVDVLSMLLNAMAKTSINPSPFMRIQGEYKMEILFPDDGIGFEVIIKKLKSSKED